MTLAPAPTAAAEPRLLVERRRVPRVVPYEFTPEAAQARRPEVRGKFLFVGARKLVVKGVTYGTFAPDATGCGYHDEAQVARDFAAMAAHGINAVRTYTVPPRWLLDLAAAHGLYVMVGLPWEQHIAFLDDPARADAIERAVRVGVGQCAGHPAVLCYAIGNEIPASIVRWHGAAAIERFLERLHDAAKAIDPGGLVTYVNFPSTEYLQVPGDLVAFNVYLESPERLEAYLARLHTLADERPLLMAEIGLDSQRNGVARQAEVMDWQVRTAFASGCAGTFVFAWTDEWHRGGHEITDWDFGLTTRDRQPKPALAAVAAAFAEAPFPATGPWPRVSVVVCSYNGARTIEDTCRGLAALTYPDYEVIVVSDGSTDRTADIARRYGFRVVETENRGLSSARNTGLQAASGEIVAYIDDDAYPDRDWLTYLAAAYRRGGWAGVGGPNVPPPEDAPLAQCVANAPGGPVHVLLSDEVAEHIPGCNMSFRRDVLEAVGGFDPQFRAAGDDVDICWRVQERGGVIGFAPAAMVWHHRRPSIAAYWRQQKGYGKAEALLERKWPEKYNALGHVTWSGRLYGRGLLSLLSWHRPRIYFGIWGSAPFQRLYQPPDSLVSAVTATPEWLLGALLLLALVLAGWPWVPAPVIGAVVAVGLGIPAVHAVASTRAATFTFPTGPWQRWRLRLVTAFLYLLQPLARLRGRLEHGLTPWRWVKERHLAVPVRRRLWKWSEEWQSPAHWLDVIEWWGWESGAQLRRGGDYDGWDLELRGGSLGSVHLLLAVEEHGAGRQLLRMRLWPAWSRTALRLTLLLGPLLPVAYLAGHPWLIALVGAVAALLVLRALQETGYATAAALRVLRAQGFSDQALPRATR